MKTLKQQLQENSISICNYSKTPDANYIQLSKVEQIIKEWLTQKRQKYAEEKRSQFPYETIDELLEELNE